MPTRDVKRSDTVIHINAGMLMFGHSFINLFAILVSIVVDLKPITGKAGRTPGWDASTITHSYIHSHNG